MNDILAFLVSLMASWVPPHPSQDNHAEQVRYTSIARDAYIVAHEKNVLELEPTQQAIVILAVASYESGYDHQRDIGKKRGDGGQSVCLGSIRVLKDTKLRNKIAKDRKECFRRLLARVNYSWDKCRHLPFRDRMSMYITGECQPNRKHPEVNAYSRRYQERITESLDSFYRTGLIDEDFDPDSIVWKGHAAR